VAHLRAESAVGNGRDADSADSPDSAEEQVDDGRGTIELEYKYSGGSDAVKEVTKCLDFCRKALGLILKANGGAGFSL